MSYALSSYQLKKNFVALNLSPIHLGIHFWFAGEKITGEENDEFPKRSPRSTLGRLSWGPILVGP